MKLVIVTRTPGKFAINISGWSGLDIRKVIQHYTNNGMYLCHFIEN